MRSAATWMLITAFLILAYIWGNNKLYMPTPEPWDTVEGKITSNRIEADKSDAGTYQVRITYEYTEEDQTRSGNRVRPDEPVFATRENAELAAKEFPVGKTVKVYVNPIEGSEPPSVLVWEFPKVISPVIFIILVLVATGMTLLVYAEYRKSD